jgi:hypothetical protein
MQVWLKNVEDEGRILDLDIDEKTLLLMNMTTIMMTMITTTTTTTTKIHLKK